MLVAIEGAEGPWQRNLSCRSRLQPSTHSTAEPHGSNWQGAGGLVIAGSHGAGPSSLRLIWGPLGPEGTA